jgi:hypothetical protein
MVRFVHSTAVDGFGFTPDGMRLVTRAGTEVGVFDFRRVPSSQLLNHPQRVEAVFASRDEGRLKTVTARDFRRGQGLVTPTTSYLWNLKDEKLRAWRSHGQEDLKSLGGYGLGPQYEVEATQGDANLLPRLARSGAGWTEIPTNIGNHRPESESGPWAVTSTAAGRARLHRDRPRKRDAGAPTATT